jgi:PAS domain S-box-containing protein
VPSGLQGRIDRPWRILAIAIVLVFVVLFYVDWQAVRDATKQVDSARELQQQTDLLIATVTDAEAAQRGYLLTGNPIYRSSYSDAVKKVPSQLDDLAHAAASPAISSRATHTAARQKQVELIRTLTKEKIGDMDRSIEVRDRQGADAALAVVRTDEGRLAMQQLRIAVRMLISGEFMGLHENQTESGRASDRSRIIVLVGSLALVVLLWRVGSAVDSVVRERENLVREIDDARKLLETTLASIGDAVIVTDASGAIRFMNPVAERLTGWYLDGAGKRSLNDIFNVVDDLTGSTIADPFSHLNDKDAALEQLVLLSKDGSSRPIEDSSAHIRDAAGRELGVVLVFRDITARRSAERDLERWKETFSRAGFGMFLADPKNAKIIDVNPTFASMHGYSVSELLGFELHGLVPKDSVAKLSESLQSAIDKGRNMFEQPHMRRDGTRFPSLVDVSRFNIGRAEYLAGYCSDITERKRLEDAIKESEERFRTLASALPQLIWSAGSDGRIDYVNQMWVNYAGWKSGDDVAQYVPLYPWQDLIHSEDCAEYFTRWRKSLETGNTFEVQIRLRRSSDSSYRWFLCRAVPVYDRNGRVVRWLGGCTDIQQQMEDAAQL